MLLRKFIANFMRTIALTRAEPSARREPPALRLRISICNVDVLWRLASRCEQSNSIQEQHNQIPDQHNGHHPRYRECQGLPRFAVTFKPLGLRGQSSMIRW